MMEEKGIRRVLVLEWASCASSAGPSCGALVAPPPVEGGLSDDRIRRAVLAAMRREPWADTFYTLVEVNNGVVNSTASCAPRR